MFDLLVGDDDDRLQSDSKMKCNGFWREASIVFVVVCEREILPISFDFPISPFPQISEKA